MPEARPPRFKVVQPKRVASKAVVPEVDPMELQDLSPTDARSFNAGIPFVSGPNPAARPFRFAGDDDARTRATDCLAAAVYYEAGDDAVGEKAVAQVVLNRLRHPAFPKSVCGVVFQGEERSTGCQFTFTCDGAITRYKPSEAAWRRAREVAAAALAGAVYRPVGLATHYHTDWVVPYWSASLDKIAEVHTHLFFRWTGWWGTPPAFNRRPVGGEPGIAKMAALSDTHRLADALVEADEAIAAAAPLPGAVPLPLASEPDTFLVRLDPAKSAGFPALAAQACGDRSRCKFMGWTEPRAVPPTMPMAPEAIAAMSFSYLRDRAFGFERTLWNCDQFPAVTRANCMKRMPPAPAPTAIPAIAPPAVVPTTTGPAALDGVRRRAPQPGPTPRTAPPSQP